MKFGKHIRTVAYPPWADRYVDYKGLKKLMKPLENGQGTSEEEARFVAALYAETDKIDAFFTAKESEFYAEFRLFCIQVNETKVECCRQRCATLEEVVQAYDGTAAGMVIRSFVDYTHKLETLRKFVMINVLAIIKITKKHDKHSQMAIQAELVKAVHSRYFYRSDKFGTLITDVEVLAMQLMSRLADQRVSPETLVCPSCAQVLCNPIVLPCGHRFCMRCVSAASYFKVGYRCPVCLQHHTLDLDTVRYGSMLSPTPPCFPPALPGTSAPAGGLDWRTHVGSPAPAAAAAAAAEGKDGGGNWGQGHGGEDRRAEKKDDIVYRPAKPAARKDAGGAAGSGGTAAVVVTAVRRACSGGAGWRGGAGGEGKKGARRRGEAQRVIEESVMRTSNVPDLAQSALSMSPDSVDGISLIESSLDIEARTRLPITGMAVRAARGGGALVVTEVVPGGPAARCGGIRRGDVVVAVDPGGGYTSSGYWQYEEAGNRRWIDVRGWPEGQLPELLQGDPGSSLWLRLRRGDRETVAHLVRGDAGGALFEEPPLEVVLVAADGERVALPHTLATEIRPVRDAFEPDIGPRNPAAPAPHSPMGPAPTAGTHRPRAYDGGDGREWGGGGGSGREEGRRRAGKGLVNGREGEEEGLGGVEAVTFEVVDKSGLCSGGNIRALLARIDPGYTSSLPPPSLAPPSPAGQHRGAAGAGAGREMGGGRAAGEEEGELCSAMRGLLCTPDPGLMARRLANEVLDAQRDLTATDAALAAAERHLAPALGLPDLSAHPKLAVALGHVRVAVQQLRHDRAGLTDRLATPEARLTLRRLARARARAQWRALPSVVSWAAGGGGGGGWWWGDGSDGDGDGSGPAGGEAADAARRRVWEVLERVCVLLRVAAMLHVPRGVRALTREVADALAECDDAEQLLAAAGLLPDPLRPDEAADAAAVLELAAAGAPESASALAAGLSRAVVKRVGGGSPLHALGENLLVALLREIDDSGWRYLTVAAPSAPGGGGWGGGGRGADECTMLVHVQSRVLLQLRHRTRRASVVFRPAPGAEVLRCDSGGGIEPGSLAAPDLVLHLESLAFSHSASAPAAGGGGGGGARGRRVPAEGLGQVGEWRTCVQRGRLVWTNGGSALHLTRAGGLLFLPSRDKASAVVLDHGWVRPVPRSDAVARLVYQP